MNEGVDALITDYSVDALKGSTSFHLAVHGTNLYIADPIFLETSTQIEVREGLVCYHSPCIFINV